MSYDPNDLDPTTITEIPVPADERPRRAVPTRGLVAGAVALVVALGGAALAVGGTTADDRVDASGVEAAETTTTLTDDTTTTTEAEIEAEVLAAGAAGASSSGSGGGGGAAVPAAKGLLSFSAPMFDLGPGTDQQTITLQNVGNGSADWQINHALPAWFDIAPTSGSLAPGASVDLVFTADRTVLGNGVHQTDVGFSATGDFTGQQHLGVSMAVEKAEITHVVGAPPVICHMHSPGVGPKGAQIVVQGKHMAKADLVWAKIGAPGADLQKSLDYDQANDRWITTYSSKTLGVHHLSAYATGAGAVPGDAGAGTITVIWCP